MSDSTLRATLILKSFRQAGENYFNLSRLSTEISSSTASQ